jgi:hypothetical protein
MGRSALQTVVFAHFKLSPLRTSNVVIPRFEYRHLESYLYRRGRVKLKSRVIHTPSAWPLAFPLIAVRVCVRMLKSFKQVEIWRKT